MESSFADESDNIVSAIQYLYKNQQYVDFHFISHDGCKTFGAHKLVLATQSPVLSKLVYGQPPCSEIKVENVENIALQNVIKYFYNEDLIFEDVSNIRQTKQLADLYEVPQLGEICKTKFIQMQINDSNVLSALEFAKELGNETKQAECLSIIGKNQESVLTSQEFFNMQFECALDVYEKLRERKIITEYVFLRSAIRWIQINDMLSKKNLIMKKVDIHLMSIDEYLDIIEVQPQFFSSIEIANATKAIRHFSGTRTIMQVSENNNEDYTDRNSEPDVQNVSSDEIDGSSGVDETTNSTQQENASVTSSSSDIEILDEATEETALGSFVQAMPLCISSPAGESTPENSQSVAISEPEYEKHSYEERTHHCECQRPRPDIYRTTVNVFSFLLRGVPAGVVIGFCFTLVFPQTNVFAVEKDDMVSQTITMIQELNKEIFLQDQMMSGIKTMVDELNNNNTILKHPMVSEIKLMIDELKSDKHLKDTVISEMKTMVDLLVANDSKLLKDQMRCENFISSFEDDIKEIKEESSKVNQMLNSVATVLEKQMDSLEVHEKKADEKVTLFTKQITQLNHAINILKRQTEDLEEQFKLIKLNLEEESWFTKLFNLPEAIISYILNIIKVDLLSTDLNIKKLICSFLVLFVYHNSSK